MGFWGPLDSPFYTGDHVTTSGTPSETGGVTRCVPETITLDGYTFAVDLKEWRSGPQDTFRDSVVAGDQATDALFNTKGAWARNRYSWHHGAGQQLGDLDEAADPFRYESSYGITWHEKYQATLLHATTLEQADAASNPILCRSGIYVFMGAGTKLYRTTDLDTWTELTAPGGTIQALSTDGTDLYVATSTKLVRYLGSDTTHTANFTSTPVNADCSNVAFMSNNLFIGVGAALKTVSATGTLATIKTHFQAAFRWTTMFNVGSRMYVGGFAGIRSELYTLTTDSSGNPVLSQEAAPLPPGELLRAGISYAGSAMLCTNNGLRMAEVTGDGTLTYGPLLDDFGDVRCATADGAYAFAGWSDMGDGRSGVGRLALADEVAPLQPAFAQDVFESTLAADVTGVARLGGRTVFAVAGSGAWVESASTYVGQGEIESGRIAFGTVERKGLIALTVEFAPLQADEAIEASVFDENDVLIGFGTQPDLSATSLEIDLQGEQVPFTRVQVVLLGPGTTTPTLFRWRLRAYPIAPCVMQWLIGLVVHEVVKVNAGEGQGKFHNLNAVMDWIEGLCDTKPLVVLRIGAREYSVRVETFELRPVKWTGSGALPQGLLIVQLVKA